MTLTIEQLVTIMPYAGRARAETFLTPLNSAMEEFQINTPARAGMFLANVAHESGSLRYLRELANGTAYNGRKDLGNTRQEAFDIAAEHGLTPGPMWRGRGLIQITGYDNFYACSKDLYNDPLHLVHNPSALELPGAAARSAAWYWWHAQINPFADTGDFDGACDIINRGRKTAAIGDAIGFDDRWQAWQRAQRVLV